MASKVCGDFIVEFELVIFDIGGSRCSRGTDIVCSASIVADGGVFSPSIAF